MSRWLGIDYGSRKVGIAVSDENGQHVFPRASLRFTDHQELFDQIRGLVQTEQIDRIVVGLPLTLRGERGPQATEVQDVMCQLEEALNLPVDFEDERLTTAYAKRAHESSFDEDSLAAAAILESYLQRTRRPS